MEDRASPLVDDADPVILNFRTPGEVPRRAVPPSIDEQSNNSMRVTLMIAAASLCAAASPAKASDEIFEVWLNPSVEADVGRGTAELETAHRFRDGRDDTHFLRLWYGQDIAKGVTLAGGIEQRFTGRIGEQRALQQLSLKHGVLRSRTRLEQRFVEGDDRMGLRLRQRIGVSVPFAQGGRLDFIANAEGFVTLRATNVAGQGGLTGLRTLVGIEYEASERVQLGLGYMRAQDFRRAAADRVGHAPMLSLAFSL